MKKLLIIIPFAMVIMLALYLPKVYKSYKNVTNSKLLELGMDKAEVIRIMGLPDSQGISYFNQLDSLYFYQPPFAASSGIEIIFGSDGKVTKIIPYE
ncbi:hypothetical protein [Mongoliitalea daihaiensis]|uniref:hypothetical protein n=1 Tax=Mongoliitalea daihaiensis TaxID=2782006 RepID=UPI001F3915F8|nr:hypothetical protein [Mongoliitalea daihaiensis]UJP65614.1 hypothetical protein IPZ59_03005 [Mongoliitalea daihaiensis]